MPLMISKPGENWRNWRNCASVTLKKGASERLFHIGVVCYLVLHLHTSLISTSDGGVIKSSKLLFLFES